MTSICKIPVSCIKFIFIYSVALDINAGSPSEQNLLRILEKEDIDTCEEALSSRCREAPWWL